MTTEVPAQPAQAIATDSSSSPPAPAPTAASAVIPAAPDAAAPPPAATETAPPAVQPKAENSILGTEAEAPKSTENKALEAKPEEKKADDKTPDGAEQKKEDGSQSDETAQLPTYDAFTLPETFKPDDAKLGEFTKELAEFELNTKADHAEVQKFAQKLVDRHIAETQETLKRYQDAYMSEIEKQKSQWLDTTLKDPEIGGNRIETTKKQISEFIRTHGGTKEQQQEFKTFMDQTGLGNHPVLVRLIANASRGMTEGQPLPATQPAVNAKSKIEKRYGKI